MPAPTWRLAALLATAALTLGACTPDKTQVSPTDGADGQTSEPTDPTSSPVVPGEGAVYDQTLSWAECGALECATVQVPLDWSNPDGETIEVEINRHEARNPDARIGSLLINPGGPGGSGLDLTEYFVAVAGDELLDAYDVIGFDPRGVGRSTPVACGPDEAIDDFYIPDRPLENQDDVDRMNEITEAFAQTCRIESGAVVENVDTVSAARDMDVIRAAVGDADLHYLGFSYGTQLGATYAELYPDNVGRMVLDGAVDFLLPSEELSRGQAQGFENALTNFLRWCVARDECALPSDVEAARSEIQRLTQQALTENFPTGADWDLNGNLMVYGVVVTLYDQASWPYLEIALGEMIDDGTAAVMYELANFYLDRNGSTGEYTGNSTWVFTAIGCLDEPSAAPWTYDDVDAFRTEMEEASPTFGWWFGASTGCDPWPWTADEHITSLEAAAGAAPMMVIGTTNDPATPLEWSESLAERLDATLLVFDGEGHTAYGRSNQCIIDAVDGYLVNGEMPDSGTQC